MTATHPPASVNGAFCAALADEWARCGAAHAVIAPGSRSTPLALALHAQPGITTHVVLDERSAGFVALGLGLATGRPALVVTTSGTAAVELHPAVVEAHHARVPLLACTADRPPELHDVGAPQTVDQARLFGTAVRWYAQPGPPVAEAASSWRSLAARAWLEATGPVPGPVHLDLAFREPLVGPPGPVPPGRPSGRPWHRRAATPAALAPQEAAELARAWEGRRGVVVAGAGTARPGDDAGAVDAVLALARRLGWPVLADPRSGCRWPVPEVVAHADAVLRSPVAAEALRPEVVLQLGPSPASKVLAQWLAASGAERVVVEPSGAWLDPDRDASLVVAAPAGDVVRAVLAALGGAGEAGAGTVGGAGEGTAGGVGSAGDARLWRELDDAAATAIAATLAADPAASEPALARETVAAAEAGDVLVVSSSMPVRDVEWYARPRHGLTVLANRGANGIDGVVSTAVGVALSGRRTWLLIGDLALLHDANGLLGAAGRDVWLRVVVADNGGGGIFSFLPQATALPGDVFERLFGTPQALRPDELLAAHRLPVSVASTAEAAAAGLVGLGQRTEPVAGLVVRTDRAANVAQHDALHRAVAEAIEARLAG